MHISNISPTEPFTKGNGRPGLLCPDRRFEAKEVEDDGSGKPARSSCVVSGPSGTPEIRRRALEIISPAGFEHYFAEISPQLPPNHTGPPDEEALGTIMAKYRLDMDMGSIPMLVERHGLVTGEPPA